MNLPTFKTPDEPAPITAPEVTRLPTSYPNGNPSASESIPTDNSSTGEEGPRVRGRGPVKPEQVTGAVAGLVGVALLFVDLGLKWSRKRKLRKPTKDQLRAFAEPVGRLLSRHVDMSLFGPDLLDLTESGAAVGEYLNDGPVTDRLMPGLVQVGMERDEEPDEITERITFTETYGANKQTDEADWIGDNPKVTTLQ